ncbi:TorF family putative porin [Polymorphobacter sp. PAMC 29334]|nr:TorF family putative porin [Polymorphobacter sp. PAMC 29334]
MRPGNTTRAICAILVATGAASRAQAVEFDASAALLTDYRSRGVSLSDRQPVADASVQASLAGWFAGAEAVSTARPRDLRQDRGTDAEVDLSAGYSRQVGLFTPSAGVIAYIYPRHGPTEAEVFGSVAGSLGPATVTLGANYAPDQAGVSGGNLYTYAKAAVGIPLTPVTIKASVGREKGAFDLGRTKIDYSAGVDYRISIVTIGVKYVGNDVPRNVAPFIRHATADTVVGSVTLAF